MADRRPRQQPQSCRRLKRSSTTSTRRDSRPSMSSCGRWGTSRSTTGNRSTRERAAITGSTSAATTIAATAPWISRVSISSCASSSASSPSGACSRAASGCRRPTSAKTERVPFFLLPTLGGNDTLRGFRAYRFRGPHSILLQGEYRWEIWSAFEAALFYDAGKVAMRRERPELQVARARLRHRVPIQHGQRHRHARRCGIWQRDGKHLHIVFGGIF